LPSIAQIRKIIKGLIERLDVNNDKSDVTGTFDVANSRSSQPSDVAVTQTIGTQSTSSSGKLTVEDEMNLAIHSSTSAHRHSHSASSTTTTPDLVKVIRQETTLYEGGGCRGRYLQLAYDYLLSVPPTSVEAERAFSAAGIVCSRLRTRLGDESIDALCFLRSHFGIGRQSRDRGIHSTAVAASD
jgi:hypothetical protein